MTNNGNNVDNDECSTSPSTTRAEGAARRHRLERRHGEGGRRLQDPARHEEGAGHRAAADDGHGLQGHQRGVSGCFPNQLASIIIQGGFGYVTSVCASPKGPGGLSPDPRSPACTTDATCPGAAVGSCVASKCTTNCTTDTQCGVNGGKCNAGVCAPNGAGVQRRTSPPVLDHRSRRQQDHRDGQPGEGVRDVLRQARHARRREPPHAAEPARHRLRARHGDGVHPVEAVRTRSSASTSTPTYAAETIQSVGDAKNPFINLAPAGVDPSHVGRVPTGIAVAHKTRTEGSPLRFAFVANYATRNLSVVDLANAGGRGSRGGHARRRRVERRCPTDAGRCGTSSRASDCSSPASAAGRSRARACRRASTATATVSMTTSRGTPAAAARVRSRASRRPSTRRTRPTSRVNNWTASAGRGHRPRGRRPRASWAASALIVKDTSLDYYSSRLDVARPDRPQRHVVDGRRSDEPGERSRSRMRSTTGRCSRRTSRRSVRRGAPSNLDAAKVAAGKELFTQAGCQGCHGGDKWTISRSSTSPSPPAPCPRSSRPRRGRAQRPPRGSLRRSSRR